MFACALALYSKMWKGTKLSYMCLNKINSRQLKGQIISQGNN